MAEISPIDEKINTLNQRLKVARLGLQVERRGQKLGLRGTFPPKPDSDRRRPHQQRLSLGLPATPSGLKEIEKDAKVIAAQLIQNSFSWHDYLPVADGKRLSQMDLAEQMEAFHAQFLADPDRASRPASSRTTWETAYAPYLRQLLDTVRQRPTLTLVESIYATVKATRANSRSRQVCCTALGAFAEFLNLELPNDLREFWGNYGTGRTQPRRLPTDEEILTNFSKIPNPAWQFVYGVMATYGLRNHEVFFCDYSSLTSGDPEAAIAVLETTKTGEHAVWPFYPDWVEQFNLRDIRLPPLNTDLTQTTLQRVGQQVSTQFRRYQIPFSPYDLRHAWAVRTIHMGLPDTVAARMMGHSVAIHNRTYHRWMTHRDQQKAVRAVLDSRSAQFSPELNP